MEKRGRMATVGVVVWGVFLAGWLARLYFVHPADRVHHNHESFTYTGRLVEFRDLLGAGHLTPQWCANFRGGLGAPYFGYYQPGFFYAASLVPWSVDANRALGLTVAAFGLLGYLGMFEWVGSRFGRLSGWLAASGLLSSVYVGTEVAVRGDLSEYAAMMVMPGALWALCAWLEHRRVRHLAWLAVAAAALVVLHPVIALLGFGLLGLALGAFYLHARDLYAAVWAGAALAVAVGLSAFYWFPVFLEWKLVSPDKAFGGFYHYSRHFVWPWALVGPYTRSTAVPFTLGPIVLPLALVNLAMLASGRCEATPWQRRLVGFCLAAALALVWLMSPASSAVWERVGLLGRVQFPWRILSMVTILTAAMAGAMPRWKSERARAAVVVGAVVAMWAFSWQYTAYRLDPSLRAIETVDDLVRADFAPDLCDEWLPRGASPHVPDALRTAPSSTAGCRVDRLRREQGRLSCRVRATEGATVTLPHYDFPVGWKATLDGRPVSLAPDALGLMRVDVPAGTHGRLEVCFRPTPMRRLGLIVSAFSLAAGAGLLLAAARGAATPARPCSERPNRPAAWLARRWGPVGS